MIRINKRYLSRVVWFLRQQEKAFVANLIRVALVNFFVWLVLPVQSIYLSALGLSPSQIGWVSGTAGVGASLLSLLGGVSVCTYGIKRIFLLGSLGLAVGSLTLATAKSIATASLGVVAFLTCYYMMQYLCPVVCGSCLTNEIRVTGMQTCDALSSIPRLVAPVVGAALMRAFGGPNPKGISPLYYIVFLGSCLMCVVLSKLFSDPCKLVEGRQEKTKRKGISSMARILELFRRSSKLRLWVLLQSLIQTPWYMAMIYTPLFVLQVKEADELTIGLMQTAMWTATLFCAVPAGRLADCLGRKKALAIFIVVSLLAVTLLINAESRLTFALAGFLEGFFFLSLVTSTGMSLEVAPRLFIGEWVGVQGVVKGFMALLSPMTAGILWIAFGPYSALYVMMGSYLIALCLLIAIPETLHRNEAINWPPTSR